MLDTSTPASAVGTVPSWDAYFMPMVDLVAMRSKDPNTKIGAVIVGPRHEIRTTGYNSFPRGIRDDVDERLVRPEKYLWIEHAERNGIYNAARIGTSLEGCTIYQQVLPCMDCGRAIVQAGIVEVVVDRTKQEAYESSPKWAADFQKVRILLAEAGVKVRMV